MCIVDLSTFQIYLSYKMYWIYQSIFYDCTRNPPNVPVIDVTLFLSLTLYWVHQLYFNLIHGVHRLYKSILSIDCIRIPPTDNQSCTRNPPNVQIYFLLNYLYTDSTDCTNNHVHGLHRLYRSIFNYLYTDSTDCTNNPAHGLHRLYKSIYSIDYTRTPPTV